MKKENVLITGGAGYIGSVLTGHLLEKNYRVTCLDNFLYRQNTPFNFASNKNYEFFYGDVRDEELLKKLIKDKDVIIPLAAIVGMPACKLRSYDVSSINRDAVLLIDRLRSSNQKIIFPTTNSGYGTKSGETFCTEESPLDPISLYGTTKVEAEKYLLDSEKGAVTLRLATVFGLSPRMRTDLLVNDFVMKAVRDGYIVIYEKDFKRNYIHIKDVARCFEHCINNYEIMKKNTFNVGLDEANLSKAELAEEIKKFVPKFEIVYNEIGEDPDKRNYVVSNEKIMRTGFRGEVSLKEGIQELIKGYNILLKNNPLGNV